MNRKIVRAFFIGVIVLSVLVFLYGSIKFSRVENFSDISDIGVDIPKELIEQSSVQEDRKNIQTLVGVAIVTMATGVIGLVLFPTQEHKGI